MRNLKLFLLVFLISSPILMLNLPSVTAEEGAAFEKDDEGYYRIRIEASQWEFKVYDIVSAAVDGVDLNAVSDDEKAAYEVKHRVELPHAKTGDSVEFHLYSRDVQHGFSINELEIAEALNRPEAGKEFGAVKVVERELTATELSDDNEEEGEGVTYSSFCHIFCGLGHPDMKVKFVIGGGAIEFGPYVFWAAIALNVAIFGLTLRSIVSKISLVPEEDGTPASS